MKKTGKLKQVCNGQIHCKLEDCFVEHDVCFPHLVNRQKLVWDMENNQPKIEDCYGIVKSNQ